MSYLTLNTNSHFFERDIVVLENFGQFLAQKNRILYSILNSIDRGVSEQKIVDNLSGKFGASQVKEILAVLKVKGYISSRKQIVFPRLSLVSYLDESLFRKIKKSLEVLNFSNEGEYSILLFSNYSAPLSLEKEGNYIPIYFDRIKLVMGPYCQSLTSLKNICALRKEKMVDQYLGEISPSPHSLSFDLHDEFYITGKIILAELRKLFDIGSKESLREGSKTFNYIDKTLNFTPCLLDISKGEEIFLVEKVFQVKPFEFSKELNICYQGGGLRVKSSYQTVENLLPYFCEENFYFSKPQTLRLGLDDFFVHICSNRKPIYSHNKEITFNNPMVASGKGRDYHQSKASCLAESIERALYGNLFERYILKSSFEKISDIAYAPQDLDQFSDRQRECSGETQRGARYVPLEKYQKNEDIYWLPAWSMIFESTRWLPYSYCQGRSSNSSDPYHDKFTYCSSNGFAGGNTPEEAIAQGFFELIERDQAAIWWYNQVVMPRVDLESFSDPYFSQMEEFFRHKGKTLSVIDISFDWGISTVAAVSFDEDKNFSIGLGAHIDIKIAISRALGELTQDQVDDKNTSVLCEEVKKMDDRDCLYFKSYSKIKRKDDYSRLDFNRMDRVVEYLVDKTRKKGFDFLIQDYSREDIKKFFVYRVVVPGLSHMWPRLGNQRIYDVPIDCGPLDKKKNEHELNRIALCP